MSNGSSTMTVPYAESMSSSSQMFSSVSSLSTSSSRQQSSHIARTYRQAAQLFLTRRLTEAYSTIEPIITPQKPQQQHSDTETDGEPTSTVVAPIATASRGSRVKVWSFYLTMLNEIIQLGPEEGKHAFGGARYKSLVGKVKDGSIWEDVVQVGYFGNEGAVDAEVVVNLATLLLAHAPSQTLTQQRLETYLSASSNPTFDISSHMERSQHRRPSPHNNGTSTPRDLNTRLKLLELYTLHVLPRNEQFEEAKEFINMSEVLDDERKEAFLAALQSLIDERERDTEREEQLRKEQEEELERQRRQQWEEEKRRKEEERVQTERRRKAEVNDPGGSKASGKEPPQVTSPRRPASSGRGQQPNTKKTSPARVPPPGFYKRTSNLLVNLRGLVFSTASSISKNPMALLRLLLFILAFLLAFGRRDLRERIRRIWASVWNKIRGTVGMGVKVSYI